MAFVFEGLVESVGNLEEVTFKNGTTSKRKKVVITTVEEYPQRMVVSLADKLALEFYLKPGDRIRAYLKFRAYSSPDTDVVWNDIRCWKYESGPSRPHGYEDFN